MKILVTGNVAAGKSTICKMMYEKLGDSYVYVNADDWFNQNRLIDPVLRNIALETFNTLDKKEIKQFLYRQPYPSQVITNYFNRVAVKFEKYLKSIMCKHMIVECASFFESEPLAYMRDQFDVVMYVKPDGITFGKNATKRGLTTDDINFFSRVQMRDNIKESLCDITFVNDRINSETEVGHLINYILAYDRIMAVLQTAEIDFEVGQFYHLVKCLFLNSWNERGTLVWHNIIHVLEMLNGYMLMNNCNEPLDPAIVAAIIMHDLDYKVGCDNNEINAARIVEYTGFPRAMKTEVKKLIISTGDTIHRNEKEEILHDLDWSFFGRCWDEYKSYKKAIRMEYEPIVGTRKYVEGRLKFLDKYEMAEIFYKDDGKKNETARVNIYKEINELKDELQDIEDEEDLRFFPGSDV